MCALFSPDILQAWAVKGVKEQKYDFFIKEHAWGGGGGVEVQFLRWKREIYDRAVFTGNTPLPAV